MAAWYWAGPQLCFEMRAVALQSALSETQANRYAGRFSRIATSREHDFVAQSPSSPAGRPRPHERRRSCRPCVRGALRPELVETGDRGLGLEGHGHARDD